MNLRNLLLSCLILGGGEGGGRGQIKYTREKIIKISLGRYLIVIK